MSFPFYSVVPFAASCGVEVLEAINICLWYVLVPTLTLYNVFFTQSFLMTLLNFYRSKIERHPSLRILAIKSLIHCCVRSVNFAHDCSIVLIFLSVSYFVLCIYISYLVIGYRFLSVIVLLLLSYSIAATYWQCFTSLLNPIQGMMT